LTRQNYFLKNIEKGELKMSENNEKKENHKKSILESLEETLKNLSLIIEKEKKMNVGFSEETLKSMRNFGVFAKEAVVQADEKIGETVNDMIDFILDFSQEIKNFDLSKKQNQPKTNSDESKKSPKVDEQDLEKMKSEAILDSIKNLQRAGFSEKEANFIMNEIYTGIGVYPLWYNQCLLLRKIACYMSDASSIIGGRHAKLITEIAGEMIRK
jgi:hypothetical protein